YSGFLPASAGDLFPPLTGNSSGQLKACRGHFPEFQAKKRALKEPKKANNFATFSPRLLGIRGTYNDPAMLFSL
ncbi:MAG: hypothetical protein CMI06_04805, partial [Oceanospirillaceae bacterium]|nr:hypothetical protein [Oceanospirillaceae bacterium]